MIQNGGKPGNPRRWVWMLLVVSFAVLGLTVAQSWADSITPTDAEIQLQGTPLKDSKEIDIENTTPITITSAQVTAAGGAFFIKNTFKDETIHDLVFTFFVKQSKGITGEIVPPPDHMVAFFNTTGPKVDETSIEFSAGGTATGLSPNQKTGLKIFGTLDENRAGDLLTITPSFVPEPASLVLFGTGLLGVLGATRRKWLT